MGIVLVIGLLGIAAVGAGNLLLVRARTRPLAAPTVIVPGLAIPSAEAGAAERRARRRHRTWAALARRPRAAAVLWAACTALYAAIGFYLVRVGSIVGDAESRVAQGWYVWFSRTPHVAAVGFVWNPLPSFAAMPFFLLRGVLPDVIERAYAGNLMSACFMAGAVVQVRGAVREGGAPRWLAIGVVAAFALNPMVIYYGANGMSEAPYVFFLAATVRYLARWIHTGRLTPLAWSGLALGACYLSRYEAAVAAIGLAATVAIVSWARTQGAAKRRLRVVLCDLAVALLPFVAAFIGWAVTSWIITGSAFEYVTSQYGNTSQVQIVGLDNLPGHNSGWPLPVFVLLQTLSFAPFLPVLVIAGILHAVRSRDLRILAPILVLGPIVAFLFVSFVSGTTFGWLRLHLPVAVLGSLCVGYLFSPALASAGIAPPVERRPRAGKRLAAGAALGIVIAAAAVPTSAWAMTDRRLGVGEAPQLRWVLQDDAELSEADRSTKAIPVSAATLARRFDAMHLPNGSVVMDTFTPCASLMLMSSVNPHQFVITSDLDFERTLADPVTFGARYLLLPPPEGYGTLDAVTRAYPTLYRDGAPGAELAMEVDLDGCPKLRLYEVLESTQEGGS